MISIENVTKTFSSSRGPAITALKGITVHFAKGGACALLGENGAGKTTLLRLIMGLLRPSSGNIQVLGLDPLLEPKKVRKGLAYLPSRGLLYERLTVRETLVFFGRLHGLGESELASKLSDLAERLGLAEVLDRAYGTLSSGTRRRTELARAILGKPEGILLDEPFNSLDIPSRQKLLEYLIQLRRDGMTLVISSHITTGLSELCDRTTVLHAGTVVSHDTTADFLERHKTTDMEKAFLNSIPALS